MNKIHKLYRKIRAKIISFLKKIILDMTMSEWDPELPEEKNRLIFMINAFSIKTSYSYRSRL